MTVTVYIPSYNQKDLLIEAVDSVLAQTRAADEIIIVDDASSDDSQAVISAYAVKFPGLIKPILHEQNQGIAATRNDAIAAATSEFITYVDGDDRFLPDKLARETEALEISGADVAFSNYHNIDASGARIGVWAEDAFTFNGPLFEAVVARRFPRQDVYRFELMRTQALRDAGPFDHTLRIFEDFDMRMRASEGLKGVYVDAPLSERRIHQQGLSSCADAERFAVLRRIMRKNRALFKRLDPDHRQQVLIELRAWVANHAYAACYERFRDPEGSAIRRRLQIVKHLAYCCACGPTLITIADLHTLLLPSGIRRRLLGDI